MADSTLFPGFPSEIHGRLWTADGLWGLAYEEESHGWRLYNADGAASERTLPTHAVRQVIAEAGLGNELMRRWDAWQDFASSGPESGPESPDRPRAEGPSGPRF